MEEKLVDKLIDALWLTPLSVPLFWGIAIAVSIPNVPESWEAITWKTYVLVPLYFLFAIVYTVICIRHNALPRAKNGNSSVLFIIDAESDLFFREIEKKLAAEFEDFSSLEDGKGFKALCVEKKKVQKYNLHNTQDVVDLLQKVNCIFYISVKHRVDLVTNADNFSMQIDYGVLHGDIEEKARQFLLQTDMNNLSAPIKKRRFIKADTIDEMTFTAITLSIICKYVIGLTMLLTGSYLRAYDLFHDAKAALKQDNPEYIAPGFETVLDDRLFCACMAVATYDQDLFFSNKDQALLQDIDSKIEEANRIQPNTYSYFLTKAYVLVALDGDIKQINECIEMCKKNKRQHNWRYSDAFLSAYEDKAAMTIYKKYTQAFKYDQQLNRIVDYIEYILDKHPERYSLHLAAALVYEEMGEKILSKQHYDEYFSLHDDVRLKKVLIDKKRWTPNLSQEKK